MCARAERSGAHDTVGANVHIGLLIYINLRARLCVAAVGLFWCRAYACVHNVSIIPPHWVQLCMLGRLHSREGVLRTVMNANITH